MKPTSVHKQNKNPQKQKKELKEEEKKSVESFFLKNRRKDSPLSFKERRPLSLFQVPKDQKKDWGL